MFFPFGIDPEAYRKVVENKNDRIKLEKRMAELKKAMTDYIKCLADHPRISFSGMMYYGNLNTEYLKLKKEHDEKYSGSKYSVKSKSISSKKEKPPANSSRNLRKRTVVNYKV
jgi:hypothetical protein